MRDVTRTFADDFEGAELVGHKLKHVISGEYIGPVVGYDSEGARIKGSDDAIDEIHLHMYTVQDEGESK